MTRRSTIFVAARNAAVVTTAAWVALAGMPPAVAQSTVKAVVPPGITPAWTSGIQPISRESYWNAVECGKQGGTNPACVFYDTGLCKNDEFTLALYTPYKMVAYTVWLAVSQKKPAPTPNYAEAQRTRVVLGIKPLHAAQNPITAVAIKREGRVVKPATQTLDGGGGTFIFDFPAVAPTSDLTIDMTGQARSRSCLVEQSVLARFR